MLNEKTAARLLNSLFSRNDAQPVYLRRAWIDDAGRMCATDSYRAYRLNNPIPGVPDMDAAQGLDFGRIWPKENSMKPLQLPTLAEVKAMMEEDRRKEKRKEAGAWVYTFGTDENGDRLPAVNLKYLYDILQLFPDASAYCTTPIKPLLFKSQDGEAILVPMRPAAAVDSTRRRVAPAVKAKKRDNAPALGLRTFAALYA